MNELMGVAVLAYRNGKYTDAIDLLLQVIQGDRRSWLAWFYLAMSYAKCDSVDNAYRIFKVIVSSCPDEQLKLQSEVALSALELTSIARVRKLVAPKKSKGKSALKRPAFAEQSIVGDERLPAIFFNSGQEARSFVLLWVI